MVSQGQSVADAVRAIGVTEVTYYRWRQEFGGLKTDQVKRMKELKAENARLRRAISDLTLDKMILAEAAKRNFWAPRVAEPASTMFGLSPVARLRRPSGITRRARPLLTGTHAVWILGMAALYLAGRRDAGVKRRRRDWWLSYL